MQFDFSEDQRLLQQTVRDFLAGELPVEKVRELWESESGRSRELWGRLAEVGVPGLLVPEAHGGLGMDETDLVLVLEETGRAALAEPVIATAAVAAPMLAEIGGELAATWLPRIAAGEALVAVASPASPFVSDAHVADLLLLERDGELYALEAGQVSITPQRSNDPARRLASVEFDTAAGTKVGNGRERLAKALDRGALACAAEALGVTDRLIAMTVDYATQRVQFGVPIGSFQAVKHHLADVKVKLEYARSLVYRAAISVAHDAPTRSVDVSIAKVAATEAAALGARQGLQVHGAIGYTWEQDLHVWMRRAWSLELAWGHGAWHRARLADAVIDGALPAEPFGYSAPGA